MKIQEEKLGDIVKYHPQLLNFLDRLDIQLGFGDKTIDDICREYHIASDFFIELLQLIIKKYDFNPNYIEEFEPKLTIKYLFKSHKSFLNDYISDLEIIIENLKNEEINREKDCNLLIKFFNDYKVEFCEHLNYEDNVIYPYILELEKAISDIKPEKSIVDRIKHNPMKNYIKKHGSLDEKLNDLKSLIIKFFKPFKSAKNIRLLIKLLYELEEDLHLHELIENKILFPQAKKMEEIILQKLEKSKP